MRGKTQTLDCIAVRTLTHWMKCECWESAWSIIKWMPFHCTISCARSGCSNQCVFAYVNLEPTSAAHTCTFTSVNSNFEYETNDLHTCWLALGSIARSSSAVCRFLCVVDDVVLDGPNCQRRLLSHRVKKCREICERKWRPRARKYRVKQKSNPSVHRISLIERSDGNSPSIERFSSAAMHLYWVKVELRTLRELCRSRSSPVGRTGVRFM